MHCKFIPLYISHSMLCEYPCADLSIFTNIHALDINTRLDLALFRFQVTYIAFNRQLTCALNIA